MGNINIRELSLGDWVEIDGEPAKALCLRIVGGHIFKGVSGQMYRCCGGNDFKPIPLTPAILDTNGFEIVEESADFQLYGSPECSIFFTKGTVRYRLETPQASVVCWFVHQLQHALRLAGVEKEIEL